MNIQSWGWIFKDTQMQVNMFTLCNGWQWHCPWLLCRSFHGSRFAQLVDQRRAKSFQQCEPPDFLFKTWGYGNQPRWFWSYLSCRQQLVCIDDVSFSLKQLSCGVPQGMLLGRLLYLYYSNDMETSVHNKLLLHADKSVIISSHKDPKLISCSLSHDLKSCNEWLISNKLSLMPKKKCISFRTRTKLGQVGEFQIHYNDPSPNSIKYLGWLVVNTSLEIPRSNLS